MNREQMYSSTLEILLKLYARHFPIRRGKMRVVNSLWRAAVGLENTRRVAVLKKGAIEVPCDLNEMLQRQFYFFGTYLLEEHILDCWGTAAKAARVVFDVGANAGIYSLIALAVQPDLIVHAFEPTSEIAARLRATAKLNGLQRLHVHEVAVLRKNGWATLKRFRGELGNNEGMNFVVDDLRDEGGETVQTVGLDQFCEEHAVERIDLLKLDIQGNEYSALEGAKNLIGDGRIGIIFMELNWAQTMGVPCAASESIRVLAQAGYQFSKPEKRLTWQKPGEWLYPLSDVIARRPG